VLRQLSIAVTGKLDLNDNDFHPRLHRLAIACLGHDPIADQLGRANGSWTGSGITSTSAKNNPSHNTTLGAMEASDYKSIYGANATFNGEAIDSTAVLVKYTYYGDADFNGKVNFDDYARIDSGFNAHKTGWLNGDFDGNGKINFDDYALIDAAFNSQSGVLGRAPKRSGKWLN